jgi:hypothetical protein
MPNTSNYNLPYPVSTDFVKDGADDIQALADGVDGTLSTALGGTYPGLRLIKKQTIGTTVSSVVVNDAFSATYDVYKIMISSGVASSATNLRLTLGSTTTAYNQGQTRIAYIGGGSLNFGINNGAFWEAGIGTTDFLSFENTLINPFLTKRTLFNTVGMGGTTGGFGGGLLDNATSYTAFTITSSAGTLTGGTIYVYGYGAS